MSEFLEKLEKSAAYINQMNEGKKIDIAIVLGSGLGSMADGIENAVIIDYKDIPYFPVSTVPGHKGRLVIGEMEGKRVLFMQGRFHYYEGWTMQECVYPVQVFKTLGINNLFLTNAAGCVNKDWNAGDLMVISDHIKTVAASPMMGRNEESLGDRFFDMSQTYNKEMQAIALSCAKDLNINLRSGVYMFWGGPQFETPAEVRYARIIGADACGMSTVPEAIAASHMKMKTLGISCLTNMAAGILDQPLNHEEVLETGERVKKDFSNLVKAIVRAWN